MNRDRKNSALHSLARFLIGAVWATFAATAIAQADCRPIGSVCIDQTPSKDISGATVTLAQVGGCWEYQDTYECLSPGGVDYCAPFAQLGCNNNTTVCSTTAFNGSCEIFTKTYRCSNEVTPPPAGTIQLPNSYTIVQDTIDYSQCDSNAQNASCQLAQEICVEGPETRNVNGLDVYKDCWRYQRDYTCIASQYNNYCTPLVASGCTEAAPPVCTLTAWNNTCLNYERRYLCGDPVDPLPTNVVNLDTSYTITTDSLDASACTSLESSANCVYSGRICVEGPETRNINGLDVYKDCWRYEDQYSCASAPIAEACAYESDPKCSAIGTLCIDNLPDGSCGVYETTYKCAVTDATTEQIANCSTQTMCMDGTCFDTSYEPDNDFGKTIASMETANQVSNLSLFKGEPSFCNKGMYGAQNCCTPIPGAMPSNKTVAESMGVEAVSIAGEYVKVYGSQYIMSSAYGSQSQWAMDWAESAWDSGALTGTGNYTFYGFQFQITTSGVSYVGFDPASLMIAVFIYVVMDMMSCDQDQLHTAMMAGSGLCHHIGTWCSSKTLFGCNETRQGYCCFQSKLGRIIQEQGRPQLGKGWGTPQAPECSGFTPEEIQTLRFDDMNLTEFINDVVAQAKSSTYAVQRLEEKVNNYYTTGTPIQ